MKCIHYFTDVHETEIWHMIMFLNVGLDSALLISTADEVITRNCLSQLEYSRHDVPADKYEGCRPAAKDIQLAHYVNNSIKQLDIRRYIKL